MTPRYDLAITRKINATPALLSLLYDANLLPEQIVSERDYKSMAAVVVAYDLGRADTADKEP